MGEYGIALLIWECIAVLFACMGIYNRFFLKDKAAGFYANGPVEKVKDIIGYNHALGTLWMIFALVLALLGLLFLTGNVLVIALGIILGTVFSVLGLLVAYTVMIAPKYTV